MYRYTKKSETEMNARRAFACCLLSVDYEYTVEGEDCDGGIYRSRVVGSSPEGFRRVLKKFNSVYASSRWKSGLTEMPLIG